MPRDSDERKINNIKKNKTNVIFSKCDFGIDLTSEIELPFPEIILQLTDWKNMQLQPLSEVNL